MLNALATVAHDSSVQLAFDGETSDYTDLGGAIAHLGGIARQRRAPISLRIIDGTTVHTATVDETGHLVGVSEVTTPHSAPDAEAAPSFDSPAPATAHTAGAPTDPSVPVPAPASHSRGPGTASVLGAAGGQADTPRSENGYPVGNQYSGPAVPTGPVAPKRGRLRAGGTASAAERTSKRGARRQSRPNFLRRLNAPSLVLIVLLVLALGAYFIPALTNAPADPGPRSIEHDSPTAGRPTLSVESASVPVPGYSTMPKWEHAVSSTASATATSRGVLLVDDQDITVLDSRTGRVRYTGEIDAPIGFAVDTRIAGKFALVWQFGDTAQALFDGESQPRTYDLPEGSRISSAGSSVLIKKDNSLSTFGADGLIEVPTPPSGTTPMAIENGRLISADFDGPVIAYDIAEGTSAEIELEKPEENLHIIRWVTAGYGKVVTLWGEDGASINSGHRIQLVVHDLADGTIASTVTTTTDTVGEANWVRGQGHQRAVIGPYLFDMNSGLLLHDGTSADVEFDEPRGEIVPADVEGKPALVIGSTVYTTPIDLLATTHDGDMVITRPTAGKIAGYVAVN